MWLLFTNICSTFAGIYNKKYVLMKQSLIITIIICLFLGESFSIITKNNLKEKDTNTYCCNTLCKKVKLQKNEKDAQQAQPYLPMLNMLHSNL